MDSILAISPIDGRYAGKTKKLQSYFSEYALFKYRLHVEVEYFIALCEIPLPELKDVPNEAHGQLRSLVSDFKPEDALRMKEIEKETNHDVKAVEYFLKEKFKNLGLESYLEFIHFGLTSQDINNTAVPVSLRDALHDEYLVHLDHVIGKLERLTEEWKNVPMLARTHGQPASPTMLGKEVRVFVERLKHQRQMLVEIPISGKFGGATGNFNAHNVAYPDIDWKAFANNFLKEQLNISRYQTTTQIEHYDNLAALCDGFRRVNVILIDLCRDIWTYISMDYFKQKIKEGEIGSSAMPHKVNPIDFENAEGNLGVSNALLTHFSNKLPISRMQRDLTDSTVLRNVGVPVAHSLISFYSIHKGLGKLLLNKDAFDKDLDNNWAVVAEAIQTILRREGFPNPFEELKKLTRTNESIDESAIKSFISNLDVSDDLKEELSTITPHNYTGSA